MILLFILIISTFVITNNYTVYEDIDYSNVDVEAELINWIQELIHTYFSGHFNAAKKFLLKANNWTDEFKAAVDFRMIKAETVIKLSTVKFKIIKQFYFN